MKKINKKIIVAMSGGVDSSVAVALLKSAGVDELRSSSRTSSLGRVRKSGSSFGFANARVFDVIGVFLKLADLPTFKENEKRAKRIAKILKIPFLVLDLRKEFKKRIVDYFLDGYKRGVTPNPCVVCNKEIKFGLLLEKALALGADYVATGHYARKIQSSKRKIFKLLKAKDKDKDQSYFLWQLNQEQLKKTLLPVGNYSKSEVRHLAKKFKLPVLNVPESMEICFIPDKLEDFLQRHIKTKPGPILTAEGEKVGSHQGLPFYTIGQRKGIKLSGGPYYVVKKDRKKNALIVASILKDDLLWSRTLTARKVNWISGKKPELPLKIRAQLRYGQQPVSALVNSSRPGVYSLKFKTAQRAITAGQSVVFYKNKELLGGGIIG